MRILVLGAAAGGGFPQWNCNCGNCRRARAADPAASPRTQSSLAISKDGERWVLLNASPDLRHQIQANPALHPKRPGRDSPIVAAVLTSADVDHVAGLLTLRESQPLALYASDRVHDTLRANPIFGALAAETVPRRTLAHDLPVDLADAAGAPLGIRLTAFAVPGKIALYLEKSSPESWIGEPGDTLGLEFSLADGRRIFYIPACAEFPPGLGQRIAGAVLVFFDGTLWHDDELIAAGLGRKTGRRMGHMSVAGEGGTIAAFAGLNVARKIFVHVNNTNPMLLDDSPEHAAVEAAGWQVAKDGMELRL